MAKVAVFFTTGFEEVEALTTVDLLRRAEFDVTMVSVTGEEWVTGSHQITVRTEAMFEDFYGGKVSAGQACSNDAGMPANRAAQGLEWDELDMLILPGGPGVGNLLEHEGLVEKVLEFNGAGRMLAAICAAPRVLGLNGILKGKAATCYPGMEDQLLGAEWRGDAVVCSDNVITSRGLGTSIDFSLAIIAHFMGAEKAKAVQEAIVYQLGES